MQKKIKAIILSCITLVFFLVRIHANALVEPTKEFYVNDYADILSEETEQYILEKSVALEQETTVQIVVVTVPDLEGESLEEYATDLFREFGIGDKDKNNGLLLLAGLLTPFLIDCATVGAGFV